MNRHKIFYRNHAVRKYLVFIFFTVLTFMFWLTNKLAMDYIAVVQLVPKIKSSSAIYSDAEDNVLHVKLTAPGFFILRKNFVGKTTFYINPENILDKKQSETVKIPTANLKDHISDFFDKDIKIISIDPDTIFFKGSAYFSRKVPVNPNFSLSFKSEFRQSAPTILTPDSVIVTGAKKDVEIIKDMSFPLKKYENLEESVEDVSNLSFASNIIVSPAKVRYKIPIERCTEGKVSVPVKTINVPENNKLFLFPAHIDIKYTVPTAHYQSVSDGDFSAEADYNETASSLSRHIKVKIMRKPNFVFDVKTEPSFVEFLIQR